MPASDYKELLKAPKHDIFGEKIGRASGGNIDKTGVFYHVITKTFNGDNLFLSRGFGEYRHNLLCGLCEERGITIVFSVTMPNHTHDVFLTPDWETLSEMVRILDTNCSKYIRNKEKERLRKGNEVFRRCPRYIVVRDAGYLFARGKYVFDNPAYLKREGKYVPYECFWMFKTAHFLGGYDERLYQVLFDLSPQQVFNLYSSSTMEEIREYARLHFDAVKTRGFFYRSPEDGTK